MCAALEQALAAHPDPRNHSELGYLTPAEVEAFYGPQESSRAPALSYSGVLLNSALKVSSQSGVLQKSTDWTRPLLILSLELVLGT
jgi:hypothetical protein